MNEYQVALEFLRSEDVTAWGNDKIELLYFHLDILEELVDKATPKKPAFNKLFEDEETTSIYDEYGFINPVVCICPHCGKSGIYDFEYDVKFKHCIDCGGAIDWSDENVKKS